MSPFIAGLYRTLRITETSDEPAWCAIYANATLARCGVKPSRRLRAARGFLEWGQACEFRPGAVGVWRRLIDGVDDGIHAHVAFGVSIDGDAAQVIGGNQHNHVSLAPRHLSDLLGWRWPKPSDFLTGEVIR